MVIIDNDADGLSDDDENNNYLTNLIIQHGQWWIKWWDEVNTYVTDPNDADSDDDGLNDGDEVNTYVTDPNDDSDDDGLNDGDEVNTYVTDPNDADSDDDGLNDGFEVNNGSNPNNINDPDQQPSRIELINQDNGTVVSTDIPDSYTIDQTH